MTDIMDFCNPFIDYWVENIVKRKRDVHIGSLLALLNEDSRIAESMIDHWIARIEETHTLREEFEEIFIEVLRNFKFFPEKARPENVEYIFSKRFKLRVKDLIRYKGYVVKTAEFGPRFYEQNHIDWLMLKSINKDPWEGRLLQYLIEGHSKLKIARITNIKIDNINRDVKLLCQTFLTEKQQ